MKKQYFLILKLLIIVILIIIIYFIKKDRTNMYDIPQNSYYSDKTYDLQEIYRARVQEEFVNFLNIGEYENAYNMLSEKSKKETFNNDKNKFISFVEENIFEKGNLDNKNINFVQYDIDFKENVTEISYVLNVKEDNVSIYEENEKAGIKVKLLEYSPFKYEIEI